jgi:processive 1,2-diacylglycerol beta-glucosyltransferase
MAQRVLILSASIGSGHVRAAEAVEKAFGETHPEVEVANLDIFDFTGALFRKLYSKSYLELIERAPEFLGYLYDAMDKPASPRRKRDRIRLVFDKLNTRKFRKFLDANPVDYVLSTHFLPTELITALRAKGKFDAPQGVVVTDFEAHRIWHYPHVDQFFVSCPEAAAHMATLGADPGSVHPTGIPIVPDFSRPADAKGLARELGLDDGLVTVLVMAGGVGVGAVDEMLESFDSVTRPFQAVAIAGRSPELKERLESVAREVRYPLKVVGFTTEAPRFMAAADLLVSKPGGLTSSEALAMKLPILIVSPIPGQDSGRPRATRADVRGRGEARAPPRRLRRHRRDTREDCGLTPRPAPQIAERYSPKAAIAPSDAPEFFRRSR